MYERLMWDLTRMYSGHEVPGFSLSLVVVHRMFHLLYLIDHLDHWWCDCTFERRLCTNRRPLLLGWHNVETFDILSASCLDIHIIAPSWWHTIKGHRLLFVATPPVFSFYCHDILNDRTGSLLLLHLATLEFSACTLQLFMFG